MKSLRWTSIGVTASLAVGCVLYYNHASMTPDSGHATARGSFGGPSTGALGRDGAADYRANFAAAASKLDEQNPLRSYAPLPGRAGRMALEEIHDRGVPATARSAVLARALLSSGRLSREEKLPLIRILASLHNQENTSGANNDIALDLKVLASDSDREIAHDAALCYARLGYLPGTEFVLSRALENRAISADEYYGELAHLVPTSPPEKQRAFLAELRASSNPHAARVLAAALNSGDALNGAPFLKSSEDMAQLLRANQPAFDYGVGELGDVDAAQYKEWLRASAAIENQKTGRNTDDIVVTKLSEPGTDPRKIMSVLSSSEAVPLLASAASDSPVQRLVGIARRHSEQNPGNSDMRELVQLIEERMKNPPP